MTWRVRRQGSPAASVLPSPGTAPAPPRVRASPPAPDRFDALFAPGTVAVVGASNDSAKWGHVIARRALRARGDRTVLLVSYGSADPQCADPSHGAGHRGRARPARRPGGAVRAGGRLRGRRRGRSRGAERSSRSPRDSPRPVPRERGGRPRASPSRAPREPCWSVPTASASPTPRPAPPWPHASRGRRCRAQPERQPGARPRRAHVLLRPGRVPIRLSRQPGRPRGRRPHARLHGPWRDARRRGLHRERRRRPCFRRRSPGAARGGQAGRPARTRP